MHWTEKQLLMAISSHMNNDLQDNYNAGLLETLNNKIGFGKFNSVP